MKRTGKFIFLLFTILLCGTMTSCEDKKFEFEDGPEHTSTHEPEPTSDVIKNTYDGEVAIIDASNGQILSYFNKRLTRTTNSITENTEVVILDENSAGIALNNDELFTSLLNCWNKDKYIAVLKPGVNSNKLFAKLGGYDIEDEASEEQNDVIIYIERASKGSYTHTTPTTQRFSSEEITQSKEDDSEEIIETRNSIAEEQEEVEFVSDYTWGQIADKTIQWIKENNDDCKRNLRSQETVPYAQSKIYRFDNTYTINHRNFIDNSKIAKNLPDGYSDTSIATTTTTITVATAFSDDSNGTDIYDITVSERVDVSQCYYENIVVYDFGLYKNRYSGYCFYYPNITLELEGVDPYNVLPYFPAPINQAGEYSTVHDPGTITLSGALIGNITPTGPSGGINLSGSVSLPKTNVSTVHKEMPVVYSEGKNWAKWDYSQNKELYDLTLFLNPTYLGPYDFSKTNCMTDQAVTFIVKNSKDIGSKQLILNIEHKNTFHAEAASTGHHEFSTRSYTSRYRIKLPQVNRYFKKYRPACYKSSSTVNSGDWIKLEYTLNNNIQYKALTSGIYSVGLPEEKYLDSYAESIWRETVKALVNENNGRTYIEGEFIVGLADSNGNFVNSGLYINGDLWMLVDYITMLEID